ncbi:hypothetical protein EBB_23900 [Methylomonas sp. EbB]|uniref:Calx-beta domain-containing protein n=1 Tax=Methylomonas fluvii TaxID=1854564 RepID=A0ABR9DKU2_9GAMM|nr:Calx-beta domain-containing protein [Methylomonas fluvii]MBD9363471.1 hypothetical protein [Methylomonas fluvii]
MSSKEVLLAAAAALSFAPFSVQAWTLDFSSRSYNFNEADGAVQVNVSLANSSGDYGGCTISGDVVAAGGSATAGSDYNISGGSFSFNVPFMFGGAHSDSAPVFINIIDDTLVESTETVTLSLQNVTPSCTGDSVSAGASAVANIADNDVAPPPLPQRRRQLLHRRRPT